jgi:deoxyribodipyrimidine photo-lyase
METSIIWFKTDLRLYDNDTLAEAIANSDAVVPVYCFDENYYKDTNYGFKKIGSYRAQFVLESVANLDERLRAAGSGLVVAKGKTEDQLVQLAQKYNATTVYAKKEAAPEESKLEKKVSKALAKIGCKLKTVQLGTLYEEEDLPFNIKNLPEVFTNFRLKVENICKVRPTTPHPCTIQSPQITPAVLPTLKELGLKYEEQDSRASYHFKGGEKEGLNRVNTFFYDTHAVATYKVTRNDLMGENYSSKFGPWLAQGCLSARAVYHEIKEYEAEFGESESTYWLIFELLWRDYFTFIMCKHYTKVFTAGGIKNKPPVRPDHNQRILMQWVNGETGQDFIDANMRELKHTGYMSNRGRQNVASYLCHDLNIDWRYGAAYFEQQLIDFDVCNNYGNWAYIAGVGNDPREYRYFNIQKQAADYDPDGSYRNLWLNN